MKQFSDCILIPERYLFLAQFVKRHMVEGSIHGVGENDYRRKKVEGGKFLFPGDIKDLRMRCDIKW